MNWAVGYFGDPDEKAEDYAEFADALIAEGWRKMPSAEAIVKELSVQHFSGQECGTNGVTACSHCYGPSPMTSREIANAILALMDGGSA
jgi:hypothetical protein